MFCGEVDQFILDANDWNLNVMCNLPKLLKLIRNISSHLCLKILVSWALYFKDAPFSWTLSSPNHVTRCVNLSILTRN